MMLLLKMNLPYHFLESAVKIRERKVLNIFSSFSRNGEKSPFTKKINGK